MEDLAGFFFLPVAFKGFEEDEPIFFVCVVLVWIWIGGKAGFWISVCCERR